MSRSFGGPFFQIYRYQIQSNSHVSALFTRRFYRFSSMSFAGDTAEERQCLSDLSEGQQDLSKGDLYLYGFGGRRFQGESVKIERAMTITKNETHFG